MAELGSVDAPLFAEHCSAGLLNASDHPVEAAVILCVINGWMSVLGGAARRGAGYHSARN